ncbi:MAG TPA: hypothetical protein VNT20_18370 [Flavisolibacter sp.]|nr:hypothetical protein [Flavisolibacter sp.]
MTFLIVILSIITFGQDNPIKDITIASPNAAALGKYGDIPVSYHTGIPNIGIPIYTVQEGPLQLPISLSYHASGLKTMENASWVGAGWSLSAGGMITRSVNGAPDDRGFGSVSNVQKGHFSNYGYSNYWWLSYPGWNGCPPLTTDGMIMDNSLSVNGIGDFEPDMFTFNFLGYSGKFYFRDDRTATLVPQQDLKIEAITQTSADNIYGFVLTTPDGTEYYFGKNQLSDGNIDAYEVTSPYSAGTGIVNGTCISSWFLNRIVSADGRFSIKLVYSSEQYSYYTISNYTISGADAETESNKGYNLIKNNLQGVRLSQIISSLSTINFVPGSTRLDLSGYNTSTISETTNTDAKTLSAIQINNNQGFCKTFSFQYDYFTDNATSLPDGINSTYSVTIDKKKLRLNQIQEKSCDSSISLPPYIFRYSTPASDANFAPRSLTFAQDHWGFYNGQTSNQNLIPTYTVNNFTTYAGANREASWPEMSYGSLKQIKYPTGGTTDFEFEANDVWLSYPYYNQQSAGSTATGPGIGQSGNPSLTITCSGNPYKLVLDFHTTSNTTNGSAIFSSLSVNRTSPHAEVVIQPSAGSQTFYLTQSNMTGTDYVTAQVYEEVPQTFTGNKSIGGLRIKTITNSDSTTTVKNITSYSYLVNGESSGVLYSRPVYVELPRNSLFATIGLPSSTSTCSTNGCFFCDQGYIKSASALRPLSTTQGNHIGYNEVKVSQTNNGYNIYRYYGSDMWDVDHRNVAITNVNYSCDGSAPDFPHVPLPMEYKRGELKYEGHYNQNGDLLKDATYYPTYTEDSVKTTAIMYFISSFISNKTHYSLSTAKKTQMVVVSHDYASGNALTTIDSTFFRSSYHCMPTRRVNINSKGELLETKYKYAFDYRPAAFDTLSDCYAQYASAAAVALSTYNYQLATCTNNTSCNCKNTAYNQYQRDLSIARIAYVSCRRSKFMDPVNSYKTAHDNSKSNADGELKPILELQDRFENAPIEITSWKNGQLASAVYNKYGFTGNDVYISKDQKVYLSALSSTFTPAASTSTSVTKDSRYEDFMLASYSNGNISEEAKSNDITTSYLWDYSNNLPVAKCVNALSSQIAYTSFETDSTGNWSGVNSANVQTGDALTGNRYYKQTSFSMSKPGLNSSNFYTVSYWSASGSYTISGTQSGYPKTLNSLTIGDTTWTLYEHVITGQPTITITGSGAIDELRLYPKESLMTTFTYTPLVGITSQSDPTGRIIYYSYDKLGRLQLVRDQNQKILKKYDYKYASQQ